MAISLSAKTQKLIEQRMKQTGVRSADELVQAALQTLNPGSGEAFEKLDAGTRAALEEAFAQSDRGESRPWEEVRDELRSRFINK